MELASYPLEMPDPDGLRTETGEVATLGLQGKWLGNIMRNGRRRDHAGFPDQIHNGWFPSGALRRISLEGKSAWETDTDVEQKLIKTFYIAQADPWPYTQAGAWFKEMQPIFRVANRIFTDQRGNPVRGWFVKLNPDVVNPVCRLDPNGHPLQHVDWAEVLRSTFAKRWRQQGQTKWDPHHGQKWAS